VRYTPLQWHAMAAHELLLLTAICKCAKSAAVEYHFATKSATVLGGERRGGSVSFAPSPIKTVTIEKQ